MKHLLTKLRKTTAAFIVVGFCKRRGFLITPQNDDTLPPLVPVNAGFSQDDYRLLVKSLKLNKVLYKSEDQTFWFIPEVQISVSFLNLFNMVFLAKFNSFISLPCAASGDELASNKETLERSWQTNNTVNESAIENRKGENR